MNSGSKAKGALLIGGLFSYCSRVESNGFFDYYYDCVLNKDAGEYKKGRIIECIAVEQLGDDTYVEFKDAAGYTIARFVQKLVLEPVDERTCGTESEDGSETHGDPTVQAEFPLRVSLPQEQTA